MNFTPSKRRIDVTGWEMGCPVYVPAAPTSPIIWTSHSWSGRAGSGTVESWIGSVSESTKIKKKKKTHKHIFTACLETGMGQARTRTSSSSFSSIMTPS